MPLYNANHAAADSRHRRRSGGKRVRLAARRARHSRRLARNETSSVHAGAQERSFRRAGLQQLVPQRRSGSRRRASQAGDGGLWLPDHRRRAARRSPGRERLGSRSRALRGRGDRYAIPAPAHLDRSRRGHRAPARGDGCRHRATDLRNAGGSPARGHWRRPALLLRLDRTGGRGRQSRHHASFLGIALRQGRRQRLLERPSRSPAVSSLPGGSPHRRARRAPFFRVGEVLRRLSTDRRAGAPGRGHLAFRPDEARGADVAGWTAALLPSFSCVRRPWIGASSTWLAFRAA